MSRSPQRWFGIWSVVFLSVIWVGIASCRTSSGIAKRSEPADDISSPSIMPDEAGADGDVPDSMWSPSQRRASAGYFTVLGEYAALSGNAPRAAKFYERAYDLDPNAFLGAKLVELKAASGKGPEATADARKFVLLYPRDARLKSVYAQLLARSDKKDDAVAVFEDAVRADPRQVEAWSELVALHHEAKRPDKALDAAKRFAKAMPDESEAWITLAKLYLLQGKKKESLEPARRAYELQSRAIEPVVIYAMTLELNGKTKEAVSLYEQLYRLNPSDEGLVGRMVEIYRELGDMKDALDLIEDMQRRIGKSQPALEMQRVFILWELKRFEEAAASLETLSVEVPESDRLMYMNGLGQEKIGKFTKALDIYAKVPSNSPFRQHADMRTVLVLRELKRYEDAFQAAKNLAKATPPTWEPYELGGHILGDMNRHGEAVKFLREGLARMPSQPRLLFVLGVYQEKAGDIEGCITTMRDVIRVDSTNAAAYNYLGYLFADRGTDLDEAERLIKKALELKPADGFFTDSLGWVYFKRHDFAKALSVLQEAAKLVPDEGVVWEHIGDVHLAQGRRADAVAQFEKALGATLEAPDRKRIEGKLDGLKKSDKAADPTGGKK